MYLGGKFRLRKPISEIINKYYEPNRTFVSLFCGSCNVESLVNFDNIILNDKHEYLIAMWKDFFNGREFTNKISREEYYYIKEINEPIKTIDRPVNVNIKGSKTESLFVY